MCRSRSGNRSIVVAVGVEGVEVGAGAVKVIASVLRAARVVETGRESKGSKCSKSNKSSKER